MTQSTSEVKKCFYLDLKLQKLHKLWIWLFQGPWQRIEDFFKRCSRKWNIYNMNWTTSCCTGEERGELPGTEIFLASLGQVFVKYSQNWSAVVLGLLILWLSNLKIEGRLALLDLWFISSFKILQVFLILDFIEII